MRNWFLGVSLVLLLCGLSGQWANLALVSPALALHECDTPHHHRHEWSHRPGYGADHRHDFLERRLPKGCRGLKESDVFFGDPQPDAPELAYRGPYKVGVRTLEVINRDQLDVLNITEDNPAPLYDRHLPLEIWYPATLRRGQREIAVYEDNLGTGPGNPDRPVTPFHFAGRAARDAQVDHSGGPYPLVIVSHGYPGSRVLLSYLTENLASKGYVVVAIDHMESTHADKVGFFSTLRNRTFDIHFVLNEVARMSQFGEAPFLAGLVDDENTAIVGYSMGGYGALNAAGAGFTQSFADSPFGQPGFGALTPLQAGNLDYLALLDDRIKAIVTFAPFGGTFGIWDEMTLQGLTVPSFFITGDQDPTAPFAGVDWLARNAVKSERYYLIFQLGRHQVATGPAPRIAEGNYPEWLHYEEVVWENRKLNNVSQHFITAFLGLHLKGEAEVYSPYLDLSDPVPKDSPRSDAEGPLDWEGFPPNSALGMELYRFRAQP